jgi:ClpP class serine protease
VFTAQAALEYGLVDQILGSRASGEQQAVEAAAQAARESKTLQEA